MNKKLLSSSFLSFVVGDLATTYVGLLYYSDKIVESNPFAIFVMNEYGLLAFIPMKLIAFGVIISLYKITPDPQRLAVPATLTAIGSAVTVWNSYLLLTL